jgi:hypothetical protein
MSGRRPKIQREPSSSLGSEVRDQMSRFIGFFFSLGAASTLMSCSSGLNTTPEAIEAEISAALHKGASAEAIERYLDQRNLTFSYDRFSNRYQTIIRDPESDAHAITIYILLDDQKRYADVEARDSYTLP